MIGNKTQLALQTTRAAQLQPPPPRSAPAAALARLPRRCLVRVGAAASSVQQRSGRFEPIRVDLDLELAAHVRAAEGGGGPEVGAAWGHRCARDPGADIDELAGLHRQHSKSFQSKCSRVAAQRKAGDGRGRRACPRGCSYSAAAAGRTPASARAPASCAHPATLSQILHHRKNLPARV